MLVYFKYFIGLKLMSLQLIFKEFYDIIGYYKTVEKILFELFGLLNSEKQNESQNEQGMKIVYFPWKPSFLLNYQLMIISCIHRLVNVTSSFLNIVLIEIEIIEVEINQNLNGIFLTDEEFCKYDFYMSFLAH